MKKYLLIPFSLLILLNSLSAQIFKESFSYTVGNLSTNWTSYNSGAEPQVVLGSLDYEGLPDITGNKVQFGGANNKESERTFTAVSTGTIYYSFLLKITTLNSQGEYFTGLASGQTNYAACLWYARQTDQSKYRLGLSFRSNTTPTYYASDFNANSIVFIVIGYKMITGDKNDSVKIWINPTLGLQNEPTPSIGLPYAGTADDLTSFGRVFFRCSNANSSIYNVDEIRVATSWNDVALPVELTSFTAKYLSSGVVLNWQTATEINNNKFEVERQINEGNWEVVGEVLGHGNSNTVIDYTYTDSKTSTKGKYNYRLKQIDNDGTFKYTQVVNVTVGNLDNYELAQNYPNPFNPSTNINFTMPKAGNVKIVLFNALGQEVATLFNGNKDAGFHTVQFNANGLPSGIYFYQMTSEGFNQVKKMILTK